MGKCEFCKGERPLGLCGEYHLCYNCMMRLKDAAPKLLAALKPVLRELETHHLVGTTESEHCPVCKAIRQARTAVTKAKGEGKNESV